MKRTWGLLVLLQNKKRLLLLLKGLIKQGWLNWSLSWCKWVHTMFRSKMANLAWIRMFLEKVAVYFWSTCCPTALHITYLIHFSCGLVPHHHTKIKLKFQVLKVWKQTACSLHKLIMLDLKSKNTNK